MTLKFNIGTLRKLKELMGTDPLAALETVDTMGAIDYAEHVVHAGMLAHNSKADVSNLKDWFNEAMPDVATNIIKAFSAAYTPDVATPEGGKDTQ